MSEIVEILLFWNGYTLGVLYISYSVVDDQQLGVYRIVALDYSAE